jgi:hypothetical protein
VWNEAPIGVTALVDTSGSATAAAVEVVADLHGSAGGGNEMIRDNFYSNPGNGWSVDLTGLENGSYVVYVYAPTNTAVSTGAFTLNGEAFASMPGDAYIEGVSYISAAVEVDAGSIAMSGSDPSFNGLAGMQVVLLPEPGLALLLSSGLGLCVALHRRSVAPRAADRKRLTT